LLIMLVVSSPKSLVALPLRFRSTTHWFCWFRFACALVRSAPVTTALSSRNLVPSAAQETICVFGLLEAYGLFA
jgi:hypothetical protein